MIPTAEISASRKNASYRNIILLTISVYFFWGFAAAGNALLIAVFKKSFQLTQFKAQMVELCFYMAYFSGSLIYFMLSLGKKRRLRNLSSKSGMMIGLLISAGGSLLMVPAAEIASYSLFLTGLFITGLGFTLQQIMANPLLAQSGNANNLLAAGSFNSFGTTIAPLVLGAAIFGTLTDIVDIELEALKLPYIVLASAYLVFAILYYFVETPSIQETNADAPKTSLFKGGALSSPGLRLGMLAIFFFVGADVAIQSNLPALVASPQIMALQVQDAVHLFSLFGGSVMAGMWTGALSSLRLSKISYNILVFVAPLMAFALVLFINKIRGSSMTDLYYYTPFIAIIFICVSYGRRKPERLLFIASLIAIILLTAGLILKGQIALYCIISVAFCCAFMWPCIFPLAISGLKENTQQGASLLVMMIVGGAIIPPLQGWLSDRSFIGIHHSYFVELINFGYILFFSIRMKKMRRKIF